MDDSKSGSLEQMRAFLAGSGEMAFAAQGRQEVYEWVERTLVEHEYGSLDKPGKGLLRQYLMRMTGMSRAQVTRLIAQQQRTGRVRATVYERRKFTSRYTTADITLLAYVDRAHGNLSGPATQRILEREHSEYGQAAYQRLAGISVAHLYRLRGTKAYRKRNASYQPTRPTKVPIGERRKPQPRGVPGFLRIDTVHQGDQDGRKGLYHINAVDEVTQWEVVAATPHISELWLLPVLEAMLEKLRIEQTKSRAYRSGDNGLVEAKNGAVIRKHIGFGHIDAKFAVAMDDFHREHLNPYVNFHRPSAVARVVTAANGKRRRIYERWATPFELLRESPHCPICLRPGVSLAELEGIAQRQSDTEAALAMQDAKRQLMLKIERGKSA